MYIISVIFTNARCGQVDSNDSATCREIGVGGFRTIEYGCYPTNSGAKAFRRVIVVEVSPYLQKDTLSRNITRYIRFSVQ